MDMDMELCQEIDALLADFPVRKTKAQKTRFLDWAEALLRQAGYDARVEPLGRSRNLVVGQPEGARVLFTAHYDTPARLPFPNLIAPRNLLLTILFQLPLVVLMFAVIFGLEFLVIYATHSRVLAILTLYVALFLFLALLYVGPANPSNVNDNTSGTATLLEIALGLPPEDRAGVAFVFFDNEEKGMLGSSAFRKAHGKALQDTLLVNFDCVSDGDHILFIPQKGLKGREDLLAALSASFVPVGEKQVEVVRGFAVYPSDQAGYPLGVGVAALRKGPLGYWLGRIHTSRDTVFQRENIALLRSGALALCRRLPAKNCEAQKGA